MTHEETTLLEQMRAIMREEIQAQIEPIKKDMATKSDLLAVESSLNKRIDTIDMKVESVNARIEAAENNLTKKIDVVGNQLV